MLQEASQIATTMQMPWFVAQAKMLLGLHTTFEHRGVRQAYIYEAQQEFEKADATPRASLAEIPSPRT